MWREDWRWLFVAERSETGRSNSAAGEGGGGGMKRNRGKEVGEPVERESLRAEK
jgi:hypothetical protein